MNERFALLLARWRKLRARLRSGEVEITSAQIAVGLAAFGLFTAALAYTQQRPPPAPRETATVAIAPPASGQATRRVPPPAVAPLAPLTAAAELGAPPPAAVLPMAEDAILAADPVPDATLPPVTRQPAPTLVFDAGDEDAAGVPVVVGSGARREPGPDAAIAPSAAVLTRGTLIPSMLESTIDTARPGSVRAMVTATVRSADGQHVLVPRASRLVGRYEGSQSGAGKGDATVVWTRIERPDGTSVLLASERERFGEAAVVSQVSGDRPGGALRVRQGEPIRVLATRNVAVGN